MARYIDVEPFIKWLEEGLFYLGEPHIVHQPVSYGVKNVLDKILLNIKKQPTADVVEVVRCKDCKHSNEYGTICRYSVGRAVEPDHFCSYGKRK